MDPQQNQWGSHNPRWDDFPIDNYNDFEMPDDLSSTSPSTVESQGPEKATHSCVIFEKEISSGKTPSCNGTKETTLSGIKQHYKRCHFPEIERCKTCNELFLRKTDFDNHGEGGRPCANQQKQPRGEAMNRAWEELDRKVILAWTADQNISPAQSTTTTLPSTSAERLQQPAVTSQGLASGYSMYTISPYNTDANSTGAAETSFGLIGNPALNTSTRTSQTLLDPPSNTHYPPQVGGRGRRAPTREKSGGNYTQLPTAEVRCKNCNLTFTGAWARGNLARHQVSHKAQLPCEKCERRFRRKDALLKHERTHHPELKRNPPRKRLYKATSSYNPG